MLGRVGQVLHEEGGGAAEAELDADGRQLVAHPGERDGGYLLVVPAAADAAVVAREPDLLEVGDVVAVDAFPERGAEGVARFVEGQGLERVFDLVRDFRVGEFPRRRATMSAMESQRGAGRRETY